MADLKLPVRQPGRSTRVTPKDPGATRLFLIGNPNAGKTRLFNRLSGLRAKTANFAGTTVDHRVAKLDFAGRPLQLMDLPGTYSLESATPEEKVVRQALYGEIPGQSAPDALLIVVDATNLERSLYLVDQVRCLGVPTVVVLNMIDLARQSGLKIDADALATQVGCPVVALSARTGEGVDQLEAAVAAMLDAPPQERLVSACSGCSGCPHAARYDWAEHVAGACSSGRLEARGRTTEALDRFLTHPAIGLVGFAGIMLGVFYLIFVIADYPMTWIETGFALAGDAVARVLPAGDLQSLVVDGVIGGVGGMLVFLPQICLLFFFIALLEDSGYMARAAFVMDRLMRRIGLPGKAFVPMLSAHACAIPAIMASRVIENRRDRLITIMVLPLLSCSARLPVYAMITTLLFGGQPWLAAVTFAGCYALGIVAALGAAFVLRRTVLPGTTAPLLIELPNYKVPSLRDAVLMTADRAWAFIRKAGTVILLISVVLWAMATYPKLPADQAPVGASAERVAQAELEYSAAGRIGKALEPVFEPLGFNWQINVGVVSSFAAREVIVSTLAIVYGVGDDVEADSAVLEDRLEASTRPDGSPTFGLATSLSLLVFYVLAMQCLPTQVVVRKETGSWTWPLLQLGYMTALAYGAALITFQVVSALA